MDFKVPNWIRYPIAFLFLTLSLLYPLYGLIQVIPQALNGRGFFALLFSYDVLHLVWLTFRSAIAALALTLAVSTALVTLLYRARLPLLRAWFETSWIIPGFLMALLVLGAQKMMGIVDRYGFHSIIVAWVLMGVPYLTLGWLRAIDDIDDREIELFRTLGGTRVQVFTRLLIPKTMHMVQSLLVHQFYWYLVSFSLVGVLGGGPPNETLEVGIYTAVHYDRVRMAEAVCFAIWQVILLGSLRTALQWISRHAHRGRDDLFTDEWNSLGRRQKPTRVLQATVGLAAVITLGLIIFNPDVFEPFVQGVGMATASAGLAIATAMFLLFLRIAAVAHGFAWLSPMIFSLAWWRVYALQVDRGPWQDWLLAALVVAVQALLFLPWALRFLGPIYRRARTREIDAIRTLGANRIQAWYKIEWPRVRGDTRFLFSIIWSFALSEVSTVILFSRGGFEPLGVWVQNQLLRFRIHEAWIGTLLIILLSVMMIQSRRRQA